MANEKRYTARQAAEAVMAKAGELVKKFNDLKKYETENSKKLGYKPSKLGAQEKDAEPKSDAAYNVEKQGAAPDRRVQEQIDPRVNPKENAEGNNAAPGARPYNTKKYGMEGQVRKSEESKDKFGMHVRQHLVDKVHHSMKEHGYETHEASPNQVKEHAHNIGIKNLNGHEVVHAADTYRHEKKDLKKDDSIQAGIAAAGGGGNAPVNAGVASSLGSAFGKSEALNKDFGANFAQAATSGSITPAKISQGAQSIAGPSPTPPPPPVKKSEQYEKSEGIAGKNTGVAKLAKFLEIAKSQELKKS